MQQTFLFQAMVFLTAAVIIVPIGRKAGLSSALGYLLAGILVGPACLKVVDHDGAAIMQAAEFGVVMLLFVVGLELEPSRLWQLRKAILGMGSLQIAVTSVVLTGLGLLLGVGEKPALVVGLTLSLSSTALALQWLNEKGLMSTPAGQSSFAVLLFQDLAVIPMLALFPLLADTPASGSDRAAVVQTLPDWVQPLAALGAVGVIVVAGRYLSPPLFRLVATTRIRELFTATALLIVVSITVLMTTVGLSPELGAFVAGVILANSEYRHELESDLDPFKALLLGLFFMAVGASIDFQVVFSNPFLILGLTVGVMTCKFFVLFGLGKIFRLPADQNFTFSLGLCQVGEFSFVLFIFSTKAGILTEELTGILTAVVAFSMGFMPLAMLFYEKILQSKSVSIEIDDKENDVVAQHSPVIIAGYGHFGHTVGRFLEANNVRTTVLDSNSDNVNWLRRLGLTVYYGDACRHDLLEIAGAAKAKLIVVAIGNEKKRLELVETVKRHFSHLHILVRSTNRYDAYDLMNAGMLHIYRETLDTCLRLGVDALTLLGCETTKAAQAASTFFVHDERTLKRLAAIHNEDEYVSVVRESTIELQRLMQADLRAANLPDQDQSKESPPSVAVSGR